MEGATGASGPSLLVLMSRALSLLEHVSPGALIETVFPHLWARTTSVRQAQLSGLAPPVSSSQMVTGAGV